MLKPFHIYTLVEKVGEETGNVICVAHDDHENLYGSYVSEGGFSNELLLERENDTDTYTLRCANNRNVFVDQVELVQLYDNVYQISLNSSRCTAFFNSEHGPKLLNCSGLKLNAHFHPIVFQAIDVTDLYKTRLHVYTTLKCMCIVFILILLTLCFQRRK